MRRPSASSDRHAPDAAGELSSRSRNTRNQFKQVFDAIRE
jgi:hypothetical protein